MRVLVGSAFGATSPVKTLSPTVYLDIALSPGAEIDLPDLAEERAVYSVDGGFEIDGETVPAFTMAVVDPGRSARLRVAAQGARLAVVGGAPLGPHYVVWNFVSSRRERIERALDDWEALTSGAKPGANGHGFDPVPGETDFIPPPPRRP